MKTAPHVISFRPPSVSCLALPLALALIAVTTTDSPGQTASVTPSAATLAKYDTNKNGRLDPSEEAAMQADEQRARGAVTNSNSGPVKSGDEVVVLSPFEVMESNNGYYASNTMSGTRLNTRIEDIGSAISVVTKQQMTDFALLNVNDVFVYEANTEGPMNFTDFTVDRNGMVIDNVQNNPQGANRIRGVGSANMAMNNFATSGRVPVDPISIESIEISRGPNSNIFGLGQGSGTVNINAASAKLRGRTVTTELRLDNLGGYRTSLDVNQPLIEGKLAVRGSYVYQHEAYNQKPSGTTTHRYNVMLRAQPFKNTSLKASYQLYDFYGTRPSSITPRDAVTYWKNLGMPTWDPIDSAVTINGQRLVTGATNPPGLGGQNFGNQPIMFVADGGIQLWEIGRMPGATATTGPNDVTGTPRMLETIADPVRTGRPLYSTVRGISDKSLYDYAKINLAGINTIADFNEMTTVELEQFLLNRDQHKLALQFGWNREHASRLNKNLVGQASATGNSNYLYVDINEKLLDGRPNPWFKRPYLGAGEPVHSISPYERNTFRGQMAYVFDKTSSDNWQKWIGRHQLVGYLEERVTKTYTYRFREANLTDNSIYAPAGRSKANQSAPPAGFGLVANNATRSYYHFYVGDTTSQNIDYGPSPIRYGTYAFNWFNPATNAWVVDNSAWGESAIQEGSAGNAGQQSMLKTRGVVLQSTLWQDRIIATYGFRHDENFSKFQKQSVLKPNGYEFDWQAMDGFVAPWASREGNTKTKGVVFKPFRGWDNIEAQARSGGGAGFGGQLLRGLTLFYNKSDSFQPEAPVINVLKQELPNPSSNGEDYGFSVNLWNDKLVIRANHYTTDQINTQNSQFGTFGQRVLRLDFQGYAGNNDAQSLQRQARNWIRAATPGITDQQVDAEVYKLMKLTPEEEVIFRNQTIRDTQDVTAKGEEIEINFNPDHFWTFKLNATHAESIDSNIAPSIPTWIAQRLPVWETIIDPRSGNKWLDQPYNNDALGTTQQTARAFLSANVTSPIALAQATQGKSRNSIREWRYNASGSLRLAKYSENRFLKNMSVGGAFRWESKATIGYYGIPINGDPSIATAFDPSRPIYSPANTSIDAFVTYTTRLFRDRVRTRFQLNARNLQEWKARLEPVGAYPDGSYHTFRIIDPGMFIFTATFDL